LTNSIYAGGGGASGRAARVRRGRPWRRGDLTGGRVGLDRQGRGRLTRDQQQENAPSVSPVNADLGEAEAVL